MNNRTIASQYNSKVYDILISNGFSNDFIDEYIVILTLKKIFVYLQNFEESAKARALQKSIITKEYYSFSDYDGIHTLDYINKEIDSSRGFIPSTVNNFTFDIILSLSDKQIRMLVSIMMDKHLDIYKNNILPIVRDYRVDSILGDD